MLIGGIRVGSNRLFPKIQEPRLQDKRNEKKDSRLLVREHVLSFRNEVQGTDREISLALRITGFLTSVRNDTRNLLPFTFYL